MPILYVLFKFILTHFNLSLVYYRCIFDLPNKPNDRRRKPGTIETKRKKKMQHEWRLKIVEENFSNNEGDETLREYTEMEAENDPKFFNWFFGLDAENIGDFGVGMTQEQKEEFKEFLELL